MKVWLFFTLVLAFAGSALVSTAAAQAEGGAIAAIDEPAEGGGGRPAPVKKFYPPAPPAGKKKASARTPPRPARWNGFVVGDKYTFLNFEVVSAEKPYYTRAAKAGGASGLVQVEVLIDTDGRVINAHARTGNKLLHPEAERAALASRFNRPTFGGKPARAVGFLVYRFDPAPDEE